MTGRSTKTFEPSPERRFRTERAAARLPALLRSVTGKRGFAAAEIITHWPLIVGERLAECTAPERLKFDRGESQGGTLEVRVEGPLALELQHLEPQIIEKVNSFCGFQATARLKITRGRIPPRRRARPAPPPLPPEEKAAIDRMVATISDDHLRKALAALGQAIRARALSER